MLSIDSNICRIIQHSELITLPPLYIYRTFYNQTTIEIMDEVTLIAILALQESGNFTTKINKEQDTKTPIN